jgi:type III secretory pathway lipoprotein EscJ
MNLLREAITRWKTTLAAMPIGQRLTLTAVPVAIVVAVALSFGLGGRSSTILLDGGRTFTNDELRQVQSAFRTAGLTGFRVEGQRIRVPERDAIRFAAAAASASGSIDGRDSELDRVLSQSNIFASSREKSEQFERARAKELEKIIRGIVGIDEATVLWDRSGKPTLAGDRRLTATVSVRPKPGVDLTQAVADSLRMTVAGAVADLRPEHVIVLNLATGQVIPVGTTAEPPAMPPVVPSRIVAAEPLSPAVTLAAAAPPVSDRAPFLAAPDAAAAPWRLTPATGSVLLVGVMLAVIAVLGRAWRTSPPTRTRRDRREAVPTVEQIETDAAHAASELAAEPATRFELDRPSDRADESPALASAAATDSDEPQTQAPDAFGFLADVDPSRLTSLLGDEHPQTVALVLMRVPPETAEAVLDALPNATRWQVERRMAHLQPAGSEIVHEIARALQRRLSTARALDATGAAGGTTASAQTDAVDSTAAWRDIARLSRSQLKQLVARVPRNQLILALKAASPDVKARVLECFRPRQANLLWEEINQLGPLRVRDLDTAQQAIAAESQRLLGRSDRHAFVPPSDTGSASATPPRDPAADAVRRRIEHLSADTAPAEAPETA